MRQGTRRLNKLERMIRRFCDDSKGTLVVVTAIASLPIMVGAGLAIDVYRAVNTASALQNSVDAAALAAASDYGATDAKKKKTAADYFHANGLGLGTGGKLETVVNGDKVTVTAETSVEASFMQVVGVRQIAVSKSATAIGVPRPVCILSLSRNANAAIHFQGHPTLTADDCVMHANSRSRSAILGKGNPFIRPLLSSAVGGIEGRGFKSGTRSGAGDVADPLRDMPSEGDGFCIPQPTLKSGHHDLSPGIYCDLKIGPHADVAFARGLYIIKGALDVQPNASLHGNGVTLDLAGPDSYFWLSANSTYDLHPPQSGPYRGTIVRQREAGSKFGSKIYGGGDITLDGTIYAPRAQILFQGGINLTLKTSATALVADTFLFRGDAVVTVDIVGKPDDYGPYASVVAGARLVK
jgi:Flp pilus assembly protein TadG